MSSENGIFKGKVIDDKTSQVIPARVRITDSEGNLHPIVMFEGWIHSLWCEGEFATELPAGAYEIAVSRGHEYDVLRESLLLKPGETVEKTYRLHHWIDMRDRHYYCGENHTHVIRGRKGQESNIAYVGLISRAEGLDYFCTGPCASLRESYNCLVDIKERDPEFYTRFYSREADEEPVYEGPPDEPEVEEYCRRVSSQDFIMHRGNEGPKARYGHVCWLNLKLLEGEMPHDHDDWSFEIWYPEKEGPVPPYTLEPHFELYHRRRQLGSCAIVSHPTQWWWSEKGVFCNNIAAELAFDTFCGPDYGAIVVASNSVDKQTLQLIWFKLLNMGYRIAGVTETDWGIDGMSNQRLGKYLTYTRTEEFTIESLAANMMKGRNLVTSGPFIFFTIDEYDLGDEVPADGRKRKVRLEVHARGEQSARLSHLQLIRNGAVVWSVDLREQNQLNPRHYSTEFEIAEDETCWYIAKCYGDDFSYNDGEVALTNPIYFVEQGFERPLPMKSLVHGTVKDSAGNPLSGIVRVSNFGEEILSQQFAEGAFEVNIPISSRISVESEGLEPAQKSIFLDYRPVQERMEYIYLGKFVEDYVDCPQMHVPVDVFGFDYLRELLKKVELEFELV